MQELVKEVLNKSGMEAGKINLILMHIMHQASLLNLSIDKAFHMLEWSPAGIFPALLKKRSVGTKRLNRKTSMHKLSVQQQIEDYTAFK